jgi:hypothetical protein
MEKEQWIENILNSTNGITPVAPNDYLFDKIQKRIHLQNKVSTKIVWLVAASIVVLVIINFSIVVSNNNQKTNEATAYLEMTVNKSNQLYQ